VAANVRHETLVPFPEPVQCLDSWNHLPDDWITDPAINGLGLLCARAV
jgi:hypothetical protein